jgi:hypothetical protein
VETIRSFQSALADLLPAPADPPCEADPAESKTLITGVVLATPVPVVENLRLQGPVLQPMPDTIRQSAPAWLRVCAARPTVPVSVPAATAASRPALATTPAPAAAPAVMPALVPDPMPGAAPAATTALTITVDPSDTADAPALPQPPPAALTEPPRVTRARENALELENLAFVERFTPVPVETAGNQPRSVPSIRPATSTAATAPPANADSDAPEAKPDFAQPAAKPAAKPQAAEPAPPAANAPVAPPSRVSQSSHDIERRRENEPQSQGPTVPAAVPAGHTEIRTEPLQQVAPAAPAMPPAREIPAAEPRRPETLVPDLQPIAPSTPHPAEARTFSLRVHDAGEQRVELKITERQGEVHVAVRAADDDLAGSLRENLGELVHKLEQTGLHAETWQPAQPTTGSGNNMDRPAGREFTGGEQSAQQQHHPRDGRQGRQQDSQQRRWTEELENSFAPDAERKIWFPA